MSENTELFLGIPELTELFEKRHRMNNLEVKMPYWVLKNLLNRAGYLPKDEAITIVPHLAKTEIFNEFVKPTGTQKQILMCLVSDFPRTLEQSLSECRHIPEKQSLVRRKRRPYRRH
ncbi:hypothetical protein RFK22_00555 [Streptococcus suis]|uniref:hypothetical protein n=1 Tax=Streptococcus suis TaxID=1307 RepID=UPI002FC68B14